MAEPGDPVELADCGCRMHLCQAVGCRLTAVAAHRWLGINYLCAEHSNSGLLRRTFAFALAPTPGHTCRDQRKHDELENARRFRWRRASAQGHIDDAGVSPKGQP